MQRAKLVVHWGSLGSGSREAEALVLEDSIYSIVVEAAVLDKKQDEPARQVT